MTYHIRICRQRKEWKALCELRSADIAQRAAASDKGSAHERNCNSEEPGQCNPHAGSKPSISQEASEASISQEGHIPGMLCSFGLLQAW